MADYSYLLQGTDPNALRGAPKGGSYSDMLAKLASTGLSMGTGGTSDLISGLINLVPSIFKGIYGASELRKANQIEAQNPRPEASVAPAINKLANYTYGQTLNQDIPGGEMYRNEIKGATSAGMQRASELGSGAEAYGAMGKMIGSQQNQFGNLAQITAQDVTGKQGAYESALGTLGGEQNRVWDWNKAQPYLQAIQAAMQLRESGAQNIFGGVSGAAGVGSEMTSPDFNSAINSAGKYGGYKGNMSDSALKEILASLSK